MAGTKSLKFLAAAAMLAAGSGAWAADSQSTPPGKPMKMDEPMHGEMKKKSMKKGDVKKAAEKKEREMKPMMEKEMTGGAKK
jgi:hypothetical protein